MNEQQKEMRLTSFSFELGHKEIHVDVIKLGDEEFDDEEFRGVSSVSRLTDDESLMAYYVAGKLIKQFKRFNSYSD